MLKKRIRKGFIILMTVIFTLSIPAYAFAGGGDNSKGKAVSYISKTKKIQNEIKKTENDIKATQEDVISQLQDIQDAYENGVMSLITEIDGSIDGGIDNLNEDDATYIQDALTNIDDMASTVTHDMKTLQAKYKKLQKIKKTKPESYLKEIKKVLDQYDEINDEITDIDATIQDLTDYLNDILTEINDDSNVDPTQDPDQTDNTTINDQQPVDNTNDQVIVSPASINIVQ